MKRYLTFVLLLFLLFAYGEKKILMEKDGGLHRIPCKINGAKMKLIFDTGATNVSISSAIAQYLLDNDYIEENDFLSTCQTKIVDGSIVDNLVLNIGDLEIAGI